LTNKIKENRYNLLVDFVNIYRRIDKRNNRKLSSCKLIKLETNKAKRQNLKIKNRYFFVNFL